MPVKPQNVADTNKVSDSPEKVVFVPEKTLISWSAKSRPFKKRPREYWVTIVAIASLLSFIMFLAEGTMPVILIISVIFLYYVLSTVEPHQVSFKITDKGVRIEDKLTDWSRLTKYWFTEKLGSTTLNFETTDYLSRMELMVLDQDVPKLRQILSKYLPEEEPEKTSFDRATDWMTKRFLN